MKKINNHIVFIFLIIIFVFLSLLYYLEPYDDSFISYRVAQNFLKGFGFRFNIGGETVEGFSNFLWVIILAFISFFGFDIVNSSIVIGMWLSIGTLWITYLIALRLFPRLSLWVLACIISTDFFVVNTVNGLETALFSFLFVLTCYFCITAIASSSVTRATSLVMAGLSTFFLSLVRPEGPVIFLSVLVFLGYYGYTKKIYRYRHYLYYSVPFFVLYLPYFIWRYIYFGYFFPNTYYARQLILFPSPKDQFFMGTFYLFTFFSDNLHFLLIVILLFLFIKKHIEPEFKLLAWLIVTYTLFIVICGGDWNHMFGTWRFMMPLTALFALVMVKEIQILCGTSFTAFSYTFLIIIMAIGQMTVLDSSTYPSYLAFEMARRKSVIGTLKETIENPGNIKAQAVNFLTNKGRLHLDAKVGLWLDKHHGADILLASRQAGRLAFFSKANFLDTDGLVSTAIAHMSREDYCSRKYMEYIFTCNPDYFVFPVTEFKKGSLFTPYLERYNYTLTHVFCDRNLLYVFDSIYPRMYREPFFIPKEDVPLYFLCLFEKKTVEENRSPQGPQRNIIFEDRWYSIGENDLVVF